ncbi:MAG: thioredoxin domain-containing protein [Methanobacteriota archaeon]
MKERRSNRLIHERSPYLLQHAHNPVEWYPWGEEAHSLAKEREMPIFLSIGYAACHWCHVMEEECFVNQEVATLLNRNFISIKVDREERPDIDRIYMTACQLMTGSGGWPLSLFLTPDLKPFYAATFIPRKSRGEMPGMLELIPYLSEVWRTRRTEIDLAGENVLEAMRGSEISSSPVSDSGYLIPDETFTKAYQTLARMFDSTNGGFGRAPKFPSIPQLSFLLQYSMTFHNEQASQMVQKTLSSMAQGGIRDQIGYGFHRYATDNAWKIPHFEKMLYDQAMNAMIYLNGWNLTGEPDLQEAGVDCLKYICNTLRRPNGGFASAEDADSPGGEGAFYLWRSEELRKNLSPEEYILAEEIWGIREQGNIPIDSGFPPGSNIIMMSPAWKTKINSQEDQQREVAAQIKKIRQKLLVIREKRPQPSMDDKVLTDWNGLAIEALATAAMISDENWMLPCAEQSASFLLGTLMTQDNRLLHRWRSGDAGIEGTAQDYIFFASGLVRLFQANGNPDYLKNAVHLATSAIQLFGDNKRGGLYATQKDDATVPVRLRDDYDGPYPSINGHAYQLFQILGIITGKSEFTYQANSLISGMGEISRKTPLGVLSLLTAACRERSVIRAVITGEPSDRKRQELWRELTREYNPGLVIIPIRQIYRDHLMDLIPGVESYLHGGISSVYICAGSTCRPPINEPDELSQVLQNIIHS